MPRAAATTLSRNIAAIDAGSNAIRLVIARARPGRRPVPFLKERYAVRLGHGAFLGRRRIDEDTIHRAIIAFRHIRDLCVRHKARRLRAVATSAAREASNRRKLVGAIRREAGIKLSIIRGPEEARLTRRAVLNRVSPPPRLIVDLGGGSLELNIMRGERATLSRTLPIGTVRLLERLGAAGKIGKREAARARTYVTRLLARAYPGRHDFSDDVAVACGGNAEALQRLAAGEPEGRIPTIDAKALARLARQMMRMKVEERMRAFDVREDRAEVMPLAALVFTELQQWLKIKRWLVPAVGVREGILDELAEKLPRPRRKKAARKKPAAKARRTRGNPRRPAEKKLRRA